MIAMQWGKLLSSIRYSSSSETEIKSVENARSPYLVDVDRIIYSSHFRKLQDKTQVHPLSKSDYVRTRLTHSLEVAGVGRSLGFGVGQYVVEKYKLRGITEHDFGYILQATGLSHDIGNPPFGHLGEEAITAFFKSKEKELLERISPSEYNNLINFDGNSQGFRIITNLAGWDFEGGLRLTYSTLGAFCKYPRSFILNSKIDDYKKQKNLQYLTGAAKSGILDSEKKIFENVAEDLGLIRLIDKESIFYRHPLAFLLESSDDICYCISDIEDAFFVKIATLKDVEKLLAPIARNPLKYLGNAKARTTELRTTSFYRKMDDNKKIEWLRGKAISNLIADVQRVFLENEEKIMGGNFNEELLKLTIFSEEIAECKHFATNRIFTSHDKINGEIMGIEAITGVLEELYKVINNPKHPKSSRINSLLQRKIDHTNTFYNNLVLIIDTVSDFTDRNILDFYRVLRGI